MKRISCKILIFVAERLKTICDTWSLIVFIFYSQSPEQWAQLSIFGWMFWDNDKTNVYNGALSLYCFGSFWWQTYKTVYIQTWIQFLKDKIELNFSPRYVILLLPHSIFISSSSHMNCLTVFARQQPVLFYCQKVNLLIFLLPRSLYMYLFCYNIIW